MPQNKKNALWLLPLIAVFFALWCWNPPSVMNPDPRQQSLGVTGNSNPRLPATPNPITPAYQQLSAKTNPAQVVASLRVLRTQLKTMPAAQAVALIRTFLDSGKDQSTHLSFVLGSDQAFSEWPTFRTFLLDTMLEVNPAAAAALSRDLLDTPTSPDEWAIALRNVGKVDVSLATSDYLRSKTETLIAYPPWQADPSLGYLNAFDVLVHTNATACTPLLSGMIQNKERKDLAHAAFLTLDKLVQRQPANVLALLAADSGLRDNYPEMVAQQFARADLRDPTQREIARSWLQNPSRTDAEFHSFASTFPNANRFVTNNLLTANITPSLEEIQSGDAAALAIIDAWRRDPSFSPVMPHLTIIHQRLSNQLAKPTTKAYEHQ